MKVLNREGLGWVVTRPGETDLGPFNSNAEAWRALDKEAGEAVNRSQDVGDWVSRKEANK